MSKDERKIYTVEVAPDAMARVVNYCEAAGLSKRMVMSRVFSWFADQPQSVQAAITESLPADLEVEILELMLTRAKKRRRGGVAGVIYANAADADPTGKGTGGPEEK